MNFCEHRPRYSEVHDSDVEVQTYKVQRMPPREFTHAIKVKYLYYVNNALILKTWLTVFDFYYVDPNFHQVAWFNSCLNPETLEKNGVLRI